MYINTHTFFSLRYGTLSPEQLVADAVAKGVKTLVLTDINNTSAAVEFVDRCRAAGIKPVLGIEFRNNGNFLYIGIARNAEGFRALNAFLTKYSFLEKPLPEIAPALEDVYFVYQTLPKGIAYFRDDEWLGVRPGHVNKLYASPVRKYLHKLVVLSPVTFAGEAGFKAHQLLRAIDLNTLITKLSWRDTARSNEMLMPEDELLRYYELYPQVVDNTRRLLDACDIDLPKGISNNRLTFSGSKEGDFRLLTKLAINGCKMRYGENQKRALQRVRKELKVIRQQDFCAYFLITWDIIRYAQSVGYHHVGRGSGANSIVAYCLRITDVEPLELDLYFERFINPYRASPPDFDIDFSWDNRDDVIDYIFKRYGQEHVALLATYNTFKGKSIIRELGKVFGLPKAEIDKIVDHPQDYAMHHGLAKTIYKYGKLIEGFPNYLSIHAGGVIISERSLYYHTALQLMPKGFPITHFDMYHAEDLGFHKFDILSQRGLGHIKDAVDLIKANQGKAIDIHDVETIKRDENVKAQLRAGKAIGCFYIESPAMRGLLSKLHCDNYTHLVAASSIIRPGVARSGMMREYIRRFHHPNEFQYLHPVFEEQLSETFGVMVYQEDVMRVVHHFADLDLDESDVLRRLMSGKRRTSVNFERLKRKFFENSRRRGHDRKVTDEVWRQIESFAGYSFSKAHSASYAVESFQSLYLKTYFPLEFMVAVINNFGGFYRTEYYFHEARMAGATLHAPCVNNSQYLTTIKGKDIYAGFVHVYQLAQKVALRIVRQRNSGGAFKDFADFVRRVKISSDQLDILIRINAFRFTGISKYELMWRKNEVLTTAKVFGTAELFPDDYEHPDLPVLTEGKFDQAFDELELLGFTLSSPFELLAAEKLPETIRVEDFQRLIGKKVNILGYYVTKKNVRTIKGKLMNFGTWIDENGQYFDTTHFPQALKRYPFRGKGIYLLTGKVVTEFGFASIEIVKMRKLPMVADERY